MDFCEHGGELQVSRRVGNFSTSIKSVRVGSNVLYSMQLVSMRSECRSSCELSFCQLFISHYIVRFQSLVGWYFLYPERRGVGGIETRGWGQGIFLQDTVYSGVQTSLHVFTTAILKAATMVYIWLI